MGISAYHFVNLVDSYAFIHYKSYTEPDYNRFEDMFKAIIVFYTAAYLNPDMTYEETEQQWNNFRDDIYFHVVELSTPYPVLNQECFRPYWDEQAQKLGISRQ